MTQCDICPDHTFDVSVFTCAQCGRETCENCGRTVRETMSGQADWWQCNACEFGTSATIA